MLSSSIFSIFRFARGMILVTTQENLLFSQSYYFLQTLSLNIFHKKLLNICHANGSQTVTSFAMPSRILGAPTVLNRMRLVWNFVFAKFFSISKKLTPQSSKTKPFVLVILQKKIKKTIFLTNFCWVLLQIFSLIMNNIQDRSSYQRYSVKKGVCSLQFC